MYKEFLSYKVSSISSLICKSKSLMIQYDIHETNFKGSLVSNCYLTGKEYTYKCQ